MDTTWFEDFLAVLEEGGFTRAAERRAVSQPAFSRRIKALEDWVGANLFDRTTHSVSLTAAGERLLPAAEEILRRLQIARADASNAAQLQHDTLKLAATHVLSLTFLPIWLRSIEALAPMTGTVQLTSDNRVACEKLMIEGRAHFLLCHDHPAVATRLTPDSFRSIEIGRGRPGAGGQAAFAQGLQTGFSSLSRLHRRIPAGPHPGCSLGVGWTASARGAGLLVAFGDRDRRDGTRRAWYVLVTAQPHRGGHCRRAFGTGGKRSCRSSNGNPPFPA
jgi:DNA-binding transcriptional LysR family regulator